MECEEKQDSFSGVFGGEDFIETIIGALKRGYDVIPDVSPVFGSIFGEIC